MPPLMVRIGVVLVFYTLYAIGCLVVENRRERAEKKKRSL